MATTPSLRALASLATPMCLRVAATLRLPDLLGDTTATAEDLAARTHTHLDALTRVLDHLVAIDVLHATDTGYQLTDLGRQLRTEVDDELVDDLDVTSAIGHADLAYVDLLHAVTTGQAAYPRQHHSEFWTDIAADPSLRASFDAKMARRFRRQAPVIAHAVDWSRFPTLVDVGGGQGTVLREILTAHPTVHGTLVDLPPTAARAETALHQAGLADRVTVIPGSFFDPLPPDAHGYLLCDILHDWPDEQAEQILARCAQALGHGRLLVIEPIRGRGATTTLDLSMLVYFGGRERTIADHETAAARHGLALHAVTDVAHDRTLLEFVRA